MLGGSENCHSARWIAPPPSTAASHIRARLRVSRVDAAASADITMVSRPPGGLPLTPWMHRHHCAVDLKSLPLWQLARIGTSNLKPHSIGVRDCVGGDGPT